MDTGSIYKDLLQKSKDFIFGKKKKNKKDSLGLSKTSGASKSKDDDIAALEDQYARDKE